MTGTHDTVVLRLRDGSRWAFAGADRRGRCVVSRMAAVAGLCPGPLFGAARVVVHGEGAPDAECEEPRTLCSMAVARSAGEPAGWSCVLPDLEHLDDDASSSLQLLNVPAYFAVVGGGVVLHAALVARDGAGYLLAGRSGAGKSTAAGRVPAPWRGLCDEMVLAVRDGAGVWWAHPWPTGSRVVGGGGGRWDVEGAVRLEGVFFLEPAAGDEARALGKGESLCLLNEVGLQVLWLLAHRMDAEATRAVRLRQFENLARIAGDVPAFRLRATLGGEFWREIERVTTGEGRLACAIG